MLGYQLLMDANNKFEKVTNLQDKDLYYNNLIKDAVQLHGIMETGSKIILKATKILGHYLIIESASRSPLLVDSSGVFNFLVARTQFFFRSKITLNPKLGHVLDISGELFQLQRRSNFRLPIPKEDRVTIRIDTHNDVPTDIRGVVLDLGLGGCLVELNESENLLLAEHLVTGKIITPSAILITFEASIRHKKSNSRDKSKLFVGIEFKRFLSGGLPELNTLIMDFYRKYFSKFTNFSAT